MIGHGTARHRDGHARSPCCNHSESLHLLRLFRKSHAQDGVAHEARLLHILYCARNWDCVFIPSASVAQKCSPERPALSASALQRMTILLGPPLQPRRRALQYTNRLEDPLEISQRSRHIS